MTAPSAASSASTGRLVVPLSTWRSFFLLFLLFLCNYTSLLFILEAEAADYYHPRRYQRWRNLNKNFWNMVTFCEGQGGWVPDLPSWDEAYAFSDYRRSQGTGKLFVGASDANRPKHDFYWVTGPMKGKSANADLRKGGNWSGGNPDNGFPNNGPEDCVVQHDNTYWRKCLLNDINCGNSFPVVCAMPLPTPEPTVLCDTTSPFLYQGKVSTVAGDGSKGSLNGPAMKAQFNSPSGVYVSRLSGDVIVSDFDGNQLRRISSGGKVSLFANNISFSFLRPSGIAFNIFTQRLLVADFGHHRIVELALDGTQGRVLYTDFNNPYGVTVHPNTRAVIVCDTYHHQIVEIVPPATATAAASESGDVPSSSPSPTGATEDTEKRSVIAGTGAGGFSDAKNPLRAQLSGPHTAVVFLFSAKLPKSGQNISSFGSIAITDTNNNRIRILDKENGLWTLAGNGEQLSHDGIGPTARFARPVGLIMDYYRNLMVSEASGCRIRKISMDTHCVTTIAGHACGYKNGPVSESEFENLGALALHHRGHIFVADTGNNMIRKIDFGCDDCPHPDPTKSETSSLNRSYSLSQTHHSGSESLSFSHPSISSNQSLSLSPTLSNVPSRSLSAKATITPSRSNSSMDPRDSAGEKQSEKFIVMPDVLPRDAQRGVVGLGSFGGALSGLVSPSSGGSVARTRMLISSIDCQYNNNDDEDISWLEHPIQVSLSVSLGGAEKPFIALLAGSLLCTTCVFIVFPLSLPVCGWVGLRMSSSSATASHGDGVPAGSRDTGTVCRSGVRKEEEGKDDSGGGGRGSSDGNSSKLMKVQRYILSNILAMCLSFFAPSVVKSSLILMVESRQGSTKTLAIFCLIVALCPLIVFGILISTKLFTHFVKVSSFTKKAATGGSDREIFMFRNKIPGSFFVETFAIFFEGCRRPLTHLIRLYAFEDMLCSCLLAVFEGVQPGTEVGCKVAPCLMFLLVVVHLAYMLLARPYFSLLENAIMIGVSFLLVLMSTLCLAIVMNSAWREVLYEPLAWLSFLINVAFIIQTIVLAAWAYTVSQRHRVLSGCHHPHGGAGDSAGVRDHSEGREDTELNEVLIVPERQQRRNEEDVVVVPNPLLSP